MIDLKVLIFNPFFVNTFLLHSTNGDCILIDPAFYTPAEKTSIDQYISFQKLTLRACYCTHGHLDHLLGANHLQQKYKIPVYLHASDHFLATDIHSFSSIFGIAINEKPNIEALDMTHQVINLDDEKITLIHVPGHSPGSVAYYSETNKFLISGDVLFNGSIGRSDLPGGDYNQLTEAIKKKLMVLDPATIVYPGHGNSTTIGKEKQTNPYLQE